MRLYLIRHGDAEPLHEDALRPLSARGRTEAEYIGLYLQRVDASIDFIYHSPLRRSRETATLVSHVMGNTSLLGERKGLLPEDDPLSFAEELFSEKRSGAVVGHLPFLHILASQLLAGPQFIVPMKYTTGSILCVEREGYGGWILRHFVPAKVLSKLL